MSEEIESADIEEELPLEEPDALLGDRDEEGSLPSLAQVFSARGIPVPEGVDDDTLFQHTLGALQLRNKVSDAELAELYQYRARYSEGKEEHGSANTAKSVETEPTKPSYLSFPQGIDQYVKLDKQSGRYVYADERWPNLKAVEAANAWLDQRKTWEQKLFSNPIEFLEEVGLKDRETRLREEIKKEILAEIQGQQTKQTVDSEVQKFWDTRGKDLIQVDAKGQYQYDLYGNPVLTRKGQAFDSAIKEAKEYGIQDPLKLLNFAYKQVESAWKRQPKAKAEQPAGEQEQEEEEQTPEQGKKAFIAKAKAEDAAGKATVRSRVVNRDATVASAARNRDSQNPNLSFGKMLESKLKAGGHLKD